MSFSHKAPLIFQNHPYSINILFFFSIYLVPFMESFKPSAVILVIDSCRYTLLPILLLLQNNRPICVLMSGICIWRLSL